MVDELNDLNEKLVSKIEKNGKKIQVVLQHERVKCKYFSKCMF